VHLSCYLTVTRIHWIFNREHNSTQFKIQEIESPLQYQVVQLEKERDAAYQEIKDLKAKLAETTTANQALRQTLVEYGQRLIEAGDC